LKIDPILLAGRFVRLEPLVAQHAEGLRLAAEADQDIWQIYPYSMLGEHFDAWWARVTAPDCGWTLFAATFAGECVGVTGFAPEPAPGIAHIGGTYFRPESRGGPVNPETKLLLLDHAFASGARRVAFKVDILNRRSHAAMLKLGAVAEGVTRQASVTWTGRVRDVTVFSILADEWPSLRSAACARLETFAAPA
jgi:RimJ/RimL family protein N-acetyltransferase